MAIINEYGFLINNDRVFLPSETINVFPCSRRGQNDTSEDSVKYYDPEARLNTERTNRLHTAVNGFKDSFIVNNSFTTGDPLVFVLAGYHIEIKNFDPSVIAYALGIETAAIYAHLRLHNNVSLDAANYFTEMLYRQSDSTDDKNYLDVIHIDEADTDKSDYFFVGVSFTKEPLTRDSELTIADNLQLYNLQLFSKVDDNWELAQYSLLPKIEHGETEDSISISGDFSIKHGTQETLKVTGSNSTVNVPLTINGPTNIYDDLSIAAKHTIAADTLNVNSINSRVKDGTITASSPISLTKDLTVAGNAAVKSLVVGERVNTDSTDTGAITVKKEVKTPKLRVDTITSNNDSILVDDKKLLVTKSLEVLAKNAIDEEDKETPAVATIDKAIIGDLVVEKNDTLNGSTGKITAKEMYLKDIGQVPALELVHFTDTDTYQLRFRFNVPLNVPSAGEMLPDNLVLTDGAGYVLTDSNDLILVASTG